MNAFLLIINADDLGMSDEINEGIFESVSRGIVTSATLLVNPPFEADIPRFLETGVSIGLHFNLTLGNPCSPAREVLSLVDENGGFFHDIEKVFARLNESEVEKELNLQVEWFQKKLHRKPCQLSFHKHLHARDNRLLKIIGSIGRTLRIPVRSTHESMRTFFQEIHVATNDHFIGNVQPSPYWTIERFQEQLAGLQPGMTELMCHPGKNMKPIPGVWYQTERNTELATLISKEARDAVSRYELINFWDAFPGSLACNNK